MGCDGFGENLSGLLVDPSDKKESQESIIKWRIPKSHKAEHILKKLFSQLIKEIVEGMIGYVRLPTIMSKLLSDNGNQEFGDFKLTILGMLGTYGFERIILVPSPLQSLSLQYYPYVQVSTNIFFTVFDRTLQNP